MRKVVVSGDGSLKVEDYERPLPQCNTVFIKPFDSLTTDYSCFKGNREMN